MAQQNIPLNIIEFWDWFQKHEHLYREVSDPEYAVEAMNNQVLSFGLFAWEIGAGKSKPHAFTISPNGNKERLALSEKIISAAPGMPDWEFHFCKQPKDDWDFTFEAYDRFLTKLTFEAKDWEYLLEKNGEGEIEIMVRGENLDVLDLDDELNAVDLVITNILGEEWVIHHLDAFVTVDDFAPEQLPRVKKMPTLREQFAKMIAPEQG